MSRCARSSSSGCSGGGAAQNAGPSPSGVQVASPPYECALFLDKGCLVEEASWCKISWCIQQLRDRPGTKPAWLGHRPTSLGVFNSGGTVIIWQTLNSNLSTPNPRADMIEFTIYAECGVNSNRGPILSLPPAPFQVPPPYHHPTTTLLPLNYHPTTTLPPPYRLPPAPVQVHITRLLTEVNWSRIDCLSRFASGLKIVGVVFRVESVGFRVEGFGFRVRWLPTASGKKARLLPRADGPVAKLSW